MAKVAFITGANGITGSAVLEHLAKNTTPAEWSQLIVTSRSPFKPMVTDPRIKFIALDFSEDKDTLIPLMKDICKPVTHAYFSSYVHKDDFAELNVANQALFGNFLLALLATSPQLSNVTLQTGGKYYGVHLGPVPSPAREDEPRRPASIDNFYFPQEDLLMSTAEGRSWSWNVIRPEAIIGTTAKPNGMNSALTYALYIITCKELGQKPKMPTNHFYWNGYEDCSYSPLLADFTVWASTNPTCQNQAFNFVNGDYFCWKYMWPRLTEYFGAPTSSDEVYDTDGVVVGVPHLDLSLHEWSKDKKEVWNRLCDKGGCPEAKASWDAGTWQYQDWVFGRTWSATVSINKARKFGYTGHIDSFDCFINTFERMKALKQIPS